MDGGMLDVRTIKTEPGLEADKNEGEKITFESGYGSVIVKTVDSVQGQEYPITLISLSRMERKWDFSTMTADLMSLLREQ